MLSLLITAPYVPADGRATPELQHDEFAWTDRSRARKLARRGAAAGAAQVRSAYEMEQAHKPIFSMETAVKALLWSCMLYDCEEQEGHGFRRLLPQVCSLFMRACS